MRPAAVQVCSSSVKKCFLRLNLHSEKIQMFVARHHFNTLSHVVHSCAHVKL